MTQQLVLSLFPGLGLLDRAFEEEGFTVVRGPDPIWGGDIRSFFPPPGKFDGIIGGDPCPFHSEMRKFVEANGLDIAEDMSGEYERIIALARPAWWLRENVPNAKPLRTPGYHQQEALIRDVWCGGETRRLRRFAFGSDVAVRPFFVETLALHTTQPENTVLASGGAPDGWVPTERHKATRKGKAVIGFKTEAFLKKAIRLQGLPPDFLDKAPFTVAGKIKAVGNGVPRQMGLAVAKAVKRALNLDDRSEAA